ncbi:hypothetical protein [Arcticibacter sp. MXS-1]|uniref:hypothetical protein n=1 Tax=Arcticibacter sp. MXS-1 TaxID=3341726 RepID=UPI0035A88274
MGTHKATKDLDLNSKDIKNVKVVNASGIVIGSATPVNNTSIALQVNGNDKAILIPRVTDLLNASAPSIANPTEGMIAYDLATRKFYVRNNSAWVTFATATLGDKQILIGDGTTSPKAVSVTGDISIDNTGVTSIGSGKVLSTMIKDGEIKRPILPTPMSHHQN